MRSILSVIVLSTGLLHATGPKLTTLTPAGGQRGSELEVKLSGARLHDTKEILFYSPGFEMLSFEPSKSSNSITAKLRIAKDCALGEHVLRIRTATGLSDLRTFFVGPFPNILEVEPNNVGTNAQTVTLNQTINGASGQDDIDCFKIALKKGDAISAEVEGMRLGRNLFDPLLQLRDETGKVLVVGDDSALLQQDPMLRFVAPEDGDYTLEVREASFSGQAGSPYRLHVGNYPRPSAVFPAGGSSGQELTLRFIEAGGESFEQKVKLPTEELDRFPVFAERGDAMSPSPNWLRISPFAGLNETPGSAARETAPVAGVAVPLAFNGIISTNAENDWFGFTAEKGVALNVDLFARRVRSPLDGVVEIFDAKGKQLSSNDDGAGMDSSIKFTAPETTNYFVRVRDHLKRGGPTFVYRVEITRNEPRLSLSIPQAARNDAQTRQFISVPQGNRFATLIAAKRANVTGPLDLHLENLPAGIRVVGGKLGAKQDLAPVVFEADTNAVLGGSLGQLMATSTNGVQGRFRHEIEFIYGNNNQVFYGTRVDKLAAAVVEAAPFRIEIVEPKVPLVQSGTIDLKIVAHREPGFDEPITVKMLWNPPGIGSQPELTIPKGTNVLIYSLNANGNAETNEWGIAMLGSATVDGGIVYASTQLAPLRVASPYLTGKIESLSLEPGKTREMTCRLEHKIPFNGKATVRLMGLPEKITASTCEVTTNDTEVTFKVTAAADAATRSTRVLFCNVVIDESGEPIPHNIASGGTLRIVPPKKPGTEKPTKTAAK